ncbi:urease subunit beta, partial [Streptomyces sp. SID7803]|nr:urease subunit beta [Streptomyces sp. SID7803]
LPAAGGSEPESKGSGKDGSKGTKGSKAAKDKKKGSR